MLLRGVPSRLILSSSSWKSTGRNTTGYFVSQKRHRNKFAFPEEEIKNFEDDYSETPNYPPIDPETRHMNNWKKARRQRILNWHASIRSSPTVEQKMMQLNAHRKHGWERWALSENNFTYDCEEFYKFITRTHLVPDFILPDVYHEEELTKKAKDLVQQIKGPLFDVLKLEFQGLDRSINHDLERGPEEIDLDKTNSIVNQVNRILIATLSDIAPHLKTCQVDHRPKLEAFWICGGLEPSEKEKKENKDHLEATNQDDPMYDRKRHPLYDRKYDDLGHTRKYDDPINQNFQYVGSSILQIRNVNPLQNYVESDSTLCRRGDSILPRFRHYLDTTYDLLSDHKYANIRPGHWSGDDHRSSLLSIHPQHHLSLSHKDNEFWKQDELSALNSQAILSSFGRLLAQAYSFGFDQFSDLDYPFSTQCISTNGLNWSFYAYQLNTMHLDKYWMQKNEKQNLCWGTKSMSILNEQGELNEEVVENLVKFYIQPPTPIDVTKTSTGEVTPYISAKLNDLPDIEREYIFENVKDMYIHKFLHPTKNPFPEIYDWERIYKIDHQTRPMEARRRFFELPKDYPGGDPYNEPYPFRNPQRIPKALFRYRRILREQKELEAVEDAKKAEKRKYSLGFEDKDGDEK